MSYYVGIELQITDRDALIAALCRVEQSIPGMARLGNQGRCWARNQIEVHDTPVHLYGYENDKRPEVADVIIRRQNVSGSSNDIGFVKTENGTYKAIISDYDRNSLKYNSTWLARLGTYYGAEKLKTEYTKKGYRFEESFDEKRRIKIRAFVPNL